MGNRISSEFKELIKERKLVKINPKEKMILKELKGAENDLKDAEDSINQSKFKWATIQGYYSMFHSARALLYSKSFREKSHYALFIALRELFADSLGNNLIRSFEEGMILRQEADYGLKFSEAGAIEIIESAERFLQKARNIIEKRQI